MLKFTRFVSGKNHSFKKDITLKKQLGDIPEERKSEYKRPEFREEGNLAKIIRGQGATGGDTSNLTKVS